jgi:hypothetical protein
MAQPRLRGKDAAECLGFEIPHPAGPAGPITGAQHGHQQGRFRVQNRLGEPRRPRLDGSWAGRRGTASIDSGGLAEALSQIVAGASFVASTVFRLRATQRIGG